MSWSAAELPWEDGGWDCAATNKYFTRPATGSFMEQVIGQNNCSEYIKSNHNAFLKTEASTTPALMLQCQQLKGEEDFSTRSFDTLESVGMTSAETGNFSTAFSAQSNETSVEKHSLPGCLSLTHADQEDTASVSRISELLKVTEEPQAQILKHDLEIPPEAKITSIPLSSFPPKMQQVMSSRAKNVSEIRQATEIPTVTYIWPVIKVEQVSSPFWDNFRKSSIPTSPNLKRHCSSPDVLVEDVKCSQITPVKKLEQEEPDRKSERSYPLILKSSNSVVSGILKSLVNIKNKDYKNMVPLSSTSPIGKQLEIPLFKGNAVVIYDGQVYILYVMTHEDLTSEMKIHGCVALLRQTTVWLIPCSAIHDSTIKVPHPLQSRAHAVKQNINPLTTLAPAAPQDKTSNFLNKTAFPSKEVLQKRKGKAAHCEKDNELRKKFGIVKDVRVPLNRICLPEFIEDFGKSSVREWNAITRTKKWEKSAKVCQGCQYTNIIHASS
ncbi:PREDICTED: ligand-dependent nuclear receptor-interacting factor 1-like [Calidris pugnax]|uniref:ligand-dependent nuclear receptor-interacting factor 1-like n=1 Tax=Calidris pugnax TaxID=198806 RepID=UPI00071E05F1|nr:PREDICTED: ligand-dependent nuclear receptor-interacting factor 1-like [Calidris pugnax]